EIRELRSLMARLEALEKNLRREQNRREKALMTQTNLRGIKSIEDMIGALKEEIRKLKSDIDQHINGHPELKHDRELLQSIPGVADVCAVELLSVLRSGEFGSARECAAFAGVVRLHTQSGSTLAKQSRIREAGRSSVRQKLYI